VLGNGGRIGASFSVSLNANRGITLNAGGGVLRTDLGSMTVGGPITGTGGLIKNTIGTLTLQGANDFTGGTTISAGTLIVSAAGVLSAANGALVVNSGGQLILNNAAQTIASLSGSGGSINLGAGHTLNINQQTDATYSGIIQNAGNLVKAGAGKLTLTAIETFSGETTINEGTLALSGFGSVNGCPNVTVNAGATLDVTDVLDGEYTFQTGQTLKGNGGIKGSVVIAPGATLAPGNSIGTLYFTNAPNLQGYTAMEITKSGGTLDNDRLVVSGNPLNYGGILTVTLAGGSDPMVGGESFDLFDASSFSGFFFSADLPPLAPDLNWWMDKLLVDGSLVVNRAPTALDKTYTRTKGTSLKVAKSELLSGAADADSATGDSVSYDALVGNGQQGATVSEDNRFIYYVPANDMSDTLQYRLKDTRGGMVTRNIQINVVSEAGLAQAVSLNAGVATTTFAGIPGFDYQIQRSTNLQDWVVVLTTNTPAGGVFEFEDHFADLGSPPASAYYRLQQP
jgi:autotransporter-associated beta strand protein